MPTATYIPLQTITLSSPATSITFSNLPSTGFRDLVLVVEGTYSSSLFDTAITFNNDGGNNYSYVSINAFIGGPSSGAATISYAPLSYNTGSGRTLAIAHIFDYSVTDKSKAMLFKSNNAGAPGGSTIAARWNSTAAISTMRLAWANQYLAGSTFSLYGIAG